MRKLLLLSFFAVGVVSTAGAKTIIVNSAADTTANDGQCTLREAIVSANTNTASGAKSGECAAGAVGLDAIHFNIPGAGVHTITLATQLPSIIDPVVIDGYTQPGSSVNTLAVGNNAVLLIELNGANAPGGAFIVSAAKNTFRGLVINRFVTASFNPGDAFRLLSAGNTIQGCYLGTNAAGNAASLNAGGVSIEAASQSTASGNNLIGGSTAAARNVIVAAGAFAIDINGADGNTVQGNYLGTNAAGSAILGRSGIQILTKNNLIGGTVALARNVLFSDQGLGLSLRESNASGNVIQGNYIGLKATGNATLGGNTVGIDLLRAPGNLIGGTAAGAGNVISGNSGGGINAADSDNLTIQGNLIGTNAAGTAAVPNPSGIFINAGVNTKIGGTTAGARNIISGNTGPGIRFALFSASAGNLIQGNYIGTDITGTKPLGNASGISLGNPTFGGGPTPPVTPGAVIIGGTTAGARNIISNNAAEGISLSTENLVVQGNYIGTDVNGAADMGNGSTGIRIEGAKDTVGGTAPGAGNVIAFSGKHDRGTTAVQSDSGIVVYGTANAILGNSVFSNLRLGIDLSSTSDNAFGVTANDTGDGDTGANNLQNYPVLKSATIEGTGVHLTGSLNSMPNTAFRLEFFGNDEIDASGFGEGKTYLGFTNVTTNGSGDAAFDLTLANAAGLRITSTATDPNGNTSEFSASLGQLLNISTRLRVQSGDNVLIAGFIVAGPKPKKVIARALGPSLDVPDPLLDPLLELHDINGTIAFNDNWKDSQQAAIKATGIPPPNDAESAIVKTLPGGTAAYTAIVRGKNNSTGTALVEVYDLDPDSGSELVNVSTRGSVEGGNNILIGGFIASNGVTRVIVRALGPSLDVSQPLADPTLELHDGNGATVATNDNWRDTQEAEISATHVPPPKNAESAIVATLAPGGYTAVVQSATAATGVALVEVFALQ